MTFFLSSTPSLTNTIYICLPQFFFKFNYGASETQAKIGRLDTPPPKEGGTCRGPHLWGAEDTKAPLPCHSLARGPPPPCLTSARLLHPIPGVCRKTSRLDKDQSVGAMDAL